MQAYQLFKARAYGADAVLLIAAVLPNNDLEYQVASARKMKLQCLIEVSIQMYNLGRGRMRFVESSQSRLLSYAPRTGDSCTFVVDVFIMDLTVALQLRAQCSYSNSRENLATSIRLQEVDGQRRYVARLGRALHSV